MAGNEAIPVPFITEADTCDVLHVVVRERRGLLDTLRGKDRTYMVIGHLQNLMKQGHKLKCSSRRRTSRFNPDYKFEVITKIIKGQCIIFGYQGTDNDLILVISAKLEQISRA